MLVLGVFEVAQLEEVRSTAEETIFDNTEFPASTMAFNPESEMLFPFKFRILREEESPAVKTRGQEPLPLQFSCRNKRDSVGSDEGMHLEQCPRSEGVSVRILC